MAVSAADLSGLGMSIELADKVLELTSSSVPADITGLSSIAFSSSGVISSGTSDGSDTASVTITGGGAAASTRGARIIAHGNESAAAGAIQLFTGNVAGSQFQLRGGNATSFFDFRPGGDVSRWRMAADGTLQQDATNGGNISMAKSGSALAMTAGAITGVSTITGSSLAMSGVSSAAIGAITTLATLTGSNLAATGVNSVAFSGTTPGVTGLQNLTFATGVGAITELNSVAFAGTTPGVTGLNSLAFATGVGAITQLNSIAFAGTTPAVTGLNSLTFASGVGALSQVNSIAFAGTTPGITGLETLTCAATGGSIVVGSTDGADNGALTLASGGTGSNARGAYQRLFGNESATQPGGCDLFLGNVSGAVFRVRGTNSTSAIQFRHGGDSGSRVTFASNGDISMDATLGGSLLFNNTGGGIQCKAATNGRIGTATLSSGTVLVNNTSVTANTMIILSRSTTSGTPGHLSTTRVANTSFTINASGGADNSTIEWLLVERIP